MFGNHFIFSLLFIFTKILKTVLKNRLVKKLVYNSTSQFINFTQKTETGKTCFRWFIKLALYSNFIVGILTLVQISAAPELNLFCPNVKLKVVSHLPPFHSC